MLLPAAAVDDAVDWSAANAGAANAAADAIKRKSARTANDRSVYLPVSMEEKRFVYVRLRCFAI